MPFRAIDFESIASAIPPHRHRPLSIASAAVLRKTKILPSAVAAALAHVDRGGVERVLEVRSVELLDHLDARAAVLRDLVDVGAFEEAEADVGVPEAVCGALVAVAIDLKLLRRSRSRRRITMF